MSKLNNIVLLLKIFIPPTLSFFINYWGDGYNHFEIIIIPFSLLIILPNIDKVKMNIIKTLILSLIFTTLTFFVSILIFLGIGQSLEYIMNLNNIEDDVSTIMFIIVGIISYCIIPPAIIFFWQEKLLIIPKSKLNKIITYSTFIVLSVTLTLFLTIDINTNTVGSSKTIAIWQFITVIALQIILYQKDIQSLLYLKKN